MRRKMNEKSEETGFKEVGPARTEGLARASVAIPKEVE